MELIKIIEILAVKHSMEAHNLRDTVAEFDRAAKLYRKKKLENLEKDIDKLPKKLKFMVCGIALSASFSTVLLFVIKLAIYLVKAYLK